MALGKNLLPTTPQAATMNRLNTGGVSAAHAERSGSPSRNGSPMATAPAAQERAAIDAAARRGRQGEKPLPSGVVTVAHGAPPSACGMRRS